MKDLRAQGGKGLLPLCFLTQDGTDHAVMESVLHELKDDPLLLGLALSLGSMVLTQTMDQEWLKGQCTMLGEILRESWFYQEILQEGREEGREEGLKEGELQGLQKDELQGLRQTVVEVVYDRFPQLVSLARSQVETIHDAVQLRRLIVKMSSVQTDEKAEQYLRNQW